MKVLTSLEMAAVAKELQLLVNCKVSKIYQPGKEEVVVAFHKANEGKLMLRIIAGQCLYLTGRKKPSPRQQLSFCKFLRKRLHNTILLSLEQKSFERVIEFTFKAKEENFKLVAEFFSKGNIILCKEDYTILSALQVQLWKDRKIKAKEKYKYPPSKGVNFLTVGYEGFKKAVLESEKENLVKTLAIDFGLGGVYSEEVCKRSGVDKNKKGLGEGELKKLFEAIKDVRELKIGAVSSGDDVFPFPMETQAKVKGFKTYNEALDDFYSQFEEFDEEKSQEDAYKEKLDEQERILKKQTGQLETVKKGIEENKEKGDLIYKNYTYVKEVLDVIKKARDKKVGWEEIEEKLKTKGIEARGREGKISLDLK